MLDGDTPAIERIAAAEVSSGLVPLVLTKRLSGRTHHRIGSHRSRYSSRAVTRICEGGAIDAARCRARCSNVTGLPRQPYCTGADRRSNAPWGTHSGALSSATTMHQCDLLESSSLVMSSARFERPHRRSL